MRDSDEVIIPGRRPSLFGAMLLSALTSAVVSVLTVLSVLRGWPVDLSPLGMAPGAAPSEVAATQDARVPDVNGMAAEAADELLSARKLRLVVRDRRSDAKVPVGAVIAQTPLAQSRIHAGGEVSVVLSTGPERIRVPALTGQALDQAKQSLEAAGLRAGQISEAQGDPGKVIVVTPEAGTIVEPGTSVALTVGRATVAVPKLIGRHLREAREILEKAGLEVGHVGETYNERKRGNLVLTQEPQGGVAVALGTKVDLVVNQGD